LLFFKKKKKDITPDFQNHPIIGELKWVCGEWEPTQNFKFTLFNAD